jgi:hypothetical protein
LPDKFIEVFHVAIEAAGCAAHSESQFHCPVCGNMMFVIAVIRDPAEIRTTIACLAKHGRGPPDEG